MHKLKIAVFGLGYVGMSLAVLMGTRHDVGVYDINKQKMDSVRNGMSTIEDADIQTYLDEGISEVNVLYNRDELIAGSDYAIIATPTNFDTETGYFDTSSVDECISKIIEVNRDCVIVVKSTIPVGYINNQRSKYNSSRILFCPEFLQEGTALQDNLNPQRIVVGCTSSLGDIVSKLFVSVCNTNSVPIMLVEPSEAECVKLFANNYLALRVAFFNELDNLAIYYNFNSKNIIDGVCTDRRIGDYYNNPSFGFGGYCLPKDVSQLTAQLRSISDFDSPLLKSIEQSNSDRKAYIAKMLIDRNANVFGFYRLNMKSGSSNFREAAVIDLIKKLKSAGKKVIVFEPLLNDKKFLECEVYDEYLKFEKTAEVIIANRLDDLVKNSKKLYTRDIFENN